MPFQRTLAWLEHERTLGSEEPERMVLATAGLNALPHSRIVAIREISNKDLLFFTQRWTRKVQEIQENPFASATIWLPLQQREIIIDGLVHPLSQAENTVYWQTLPRERQLRFAAYAPASAQAIASISVLNEKLQALKLQYQDQPVPMSDCYCGYRLEPKTFYFYTLKNDSFSEYLKFEYTMNEWREQLLSP